MTNIGQLQHLISTKPGEFLISLVWAVIVAYGIYHLIMWAIINATFTGALDDCNSHGACWLYVSGNITNFVMGLYPRDHLWRPLLVYFLVLLNIIVIAFPLGRIRQYGFMSLLTILPFMTYWLLGGGLGLTTVPPLYWSGFILNIVLFVSVTTLMLPVGVTLALCRRSQMPVVHGLARVTIDLMRGLPMVTILFVASTIIPFLFPNGMSGNRILRVVICLSLFTGAYAAEVIRGGIQVVPRGQSEAATSLGLSYWQTTGYIVLPQALEIGFPGLVNIAIGLFKDSTLLIIIGMMDLLNIVFSTQSNPKWMKYYFEGLVMVGFAFWLGCFLLSMISCYWEKRLKIQR